MDRGAWWVTVHGVAKSHTRLKRLGTRSELYNIAVTLFALMNLESKYTQNLNHKA